MSDKIRFKIILKKDKNLNYLQLRFFLCRIEGIKENTMRIVAGKHRGLNLEEFDLSYKTLQVLDFLNNRKIKYIN